MTSLTRYDAARNALAEARRVDEVKSIRDKAKAMEVYAQQAKDRTLIEHATEIRMRAEIKAGELLAQMKVRKERASSKDTLARGNTRLPRENTPPKLCDFGVTKIQSSRWQRLAAMPKEQQEEKIAQIKEKAVAVIDASRDRRKPKQKKKSAHLSLSDRCIMSVRRLIFEAIQELNEQEIDGLFAEIADELRDLRDKTKRGGDGHNSARQPT
jgi:hypothetical protein